MFSSWLVTTEHKPPMFQLWETVLIQIYPLFVKAGMIHFVIFKFLLSLQVFSSRKHKVKQWDKYI